MMRTIIKQEDGRYWVRLFGRYVGTFNTYFEAWNTNSMGNPKGIVALMKEKGQKNPTKERVITITPKP